MCRPNVVIDNMSLSGLTIYVLADAFITVSTLTALTPREEGS